MHERVRAKIATADYRLNPEGLSADSLKACKSFDGLGCLSAALAEFGRGVEAGMAPPPGGAVWAWSDLSVDPASPFTPRRRAYSST
jgi:hypothetical protein